jgi:ABC-type amino acid transport substrate-binding protein
LIKCLTSAAIFLLTCFASIGYSAAICPDSLSTVTANLPPIVKIEQEKATGAFTLNAQKKIKQLTNKTTLKIQITNWARALKSAEKGTFSAIYPALYSSERAKYLDYSLPAIGFVQLSLYGHNDNHYRDINEKPLPIKINNKTRIATLRSMSLEKSNIEAAIITEVTTFEQAFEMLRYNRVDYVFAVQEITEHYLTDKKISDIILIKSLKEEPVFIALAKNHKNYQQFQNCLHQNDTNLHFHK